MNSLNKKKTIVLVDDEMGMHQIFRILFKKETRAADYDIQYLLSGRQCLEFIEKFPQPEQLIVLTDITMPQMDGFELLAHIKSRRPFIPVIVISAYESPLYIEKAKKLGALAYFTKPLEAESLKELLKKI